MSVHHMQVCPVYTEARRGGPDPPGNEVTEDSFELPHIGTEN